MEVECALATKPHDVRIHPHQPVSVAGAVLQRTLMLIAADETPPDRPRRSAYTGAGHLSGAVAAPWARFSAPGPAVLAKPHGLPSAQPSVGGINLLEVQHLIFSTRRAR